MAAYTYPGGQNGQCLMVDNINFLFDSAQTTLENGINIVKLQYCNSLTDIDHDYMVVDVFTDSTGYNNTVCTVDTTSTFCSTGLNGIYINQKCYTCTLCPCILLCCRDSPCVGLPTFGCYYMTMTNTYYSSTIHNCGLSKIHADSLFCLDNVAGFNFNIYLCGCNANNCRGGQFFICAFGYGGEVCCNINTPAYTGCIVESTTCYKFVCTSAGCYDFYCNGTCICDMAINTFPDICLYIKLWSTANGKVCLCSLCVCNNFENTKISSVPIIWASPVKMVYYTDEATGAGTVVYNVIDAITSNCIACNLPLNTLNVLTCCVCCHIYEIVQCADGVSCIKSYALAAGQA